MTRGPRADAETTQLTGRRAGWHMAIAVLTVINIHERLFRAVR